MISLRTSAVNGTAGSGNCADDGSDSASFTVFKKPELILTPAVATTLCAEDDSLDLVYTLTGTPPNAQLSVSSSAGTCTFAGVGSAVSNGECALADGSPHAASLWAL